MCAANVSTSARAHAVPARVKSAPPDAYVHVAVIDVARMRSSVSGSVVYRRAEIRRTPSRSSSARRGSSARTTTCAPAASRVTTAVHCSPPGCTNACGCGRPPAASRSQRCSTTPMRARVTAGLPEKCSREPQRERLDVIDRILPRQRVHRVLHRVGGEARPRCRRRCRPRRKRLRAARRRQVDELVRHRAPARP